MVATDDKFILCSLHQSQAPILHSSTEFEIISATVSTAAGIVTIIGVYRAPHPQNLMPFMNALQPMLETPKTGDAILLVGDMNINLLQTSVACHQFTHCMTAAGFHCSLHDITTDYRTCPDHIWSTTPNTSAGATDAYWSDHAITWAALPSK